MPIWGGKIRGHFPYVPPKEFCKKVFHLSGYAVNGYPIIYYELKD